MQFDSAQLQIRILLRYRAPNLTIPLFDILQETRLQEISVTLLKLTGVFYISANSPCYLIRILYSYHSTERTNSRFDVKFGQF